MFKKNTAVNGFPIGVFVKTADGSETTTGTIVCKRIIDGVAGTCVNAATYDATAGMWKINLAAADMNGDVIGLKFSLANYQSNCFRIKTVTGLPDVNGKMAATLGSADYAGNTPQTGDPYAALANLQSHGDSNWATAEGFSTFDPATDPVTVGGYVEGQSPGNAETLEAIRLKTDLLGTGRVTIAAPLSPTGSLLTLVAGDDYTADHGRSIDFISDDYPDLTEATCQLRILPQNSREPVFTIEGDVLDARTLRYEIPRESSALLIPALLGVYIFSSRIIFPDEHVVTKHRGDVVVYAG